MTGFSNCQLLTVVALFALSFSHCSLSFEDKVRFSLPFQSTIDPEIQEKIDNFIKNVYLPASKTTGLGLAITRLNKDSSGWDDEDEVYATGYGFANHEKEIPIQANTQFFIGSITKSVTSMVALNVLNDVFDLKVLDTPISKLVPNFNFILIDRFRSEHVTLRDLLAHRVCTFKDAIHMDAETFNTTEEIVYRQRYAEEICGIRTSFQYNNMMYLMAAEIISFISKQPYDELVSTFLDDLQMSESEFVKRSDDFSNMSYRAQPYYIMNDVSYPMNTELLKRVVPFKPAGGLCSTPNDMIKYLQYYLNLANIERISAAYKPSIHLDNFNFKTSDDDAVINAVAYGLGWRLGSYDGWQYNFHTGYFPPYSSLISIFPELNIGIFTSTNEGPVYVSQLALHTFIFDTLRGIDNATERAIKLIKKEKAEFVNSKRNKVESVQRFLLESKNSKKRQNPSDIVGQYGSGSAGDLEIFEKFNNQTNTMDIYLSYGKWSKGWLESLGGGNYKLVWDSDMIQDFYAAGDPNGEIFITVQNGTLEFLMPLQEGLLSLGKFELGVTLDKLPPIQWAPGSCGPEDSYEI